MASQIILVTSTVITVALLCDPRRSRLVRDHGVSLLPASSSGLWEFGKRVSRL
jgi:hypothetical protein